MNEPVIAIVPAAGLGKRFGPGANKPFYPLLDKPLVVWALQVFEDVEAVSEVVPVLKEEDIGKGAQIFEQYGLSKVRRIVPGGKERQDSVHNGLKAVKGGAGIVIIHDGARPLLTADMVRAALDAASDPDCDGAIVGVPVKDTIKEVDDSLVRNTVRRDTLRLIQTPQVFRFADLLRAYDAASAERFYSTDDSALIERIGGRVRVVMGSYANIKITTPEDIATAELLLRTRTGGTGG